MKTIASYAAMTIVDLEQDNIEIRDLDCDWLNPDRRIFCTEFKAVRGDALFNAVTPGNIWESHERDGRADRIPAALSLAWRPGSWLMRAPGYMRAAPWTPTNRPNRSAAPNLYPFPRNTARPYAGLSRFKSHPI